MPGVRITSFDTFLAGEDRILCQVTSNLMSVLKSEAGTEESKQPPGKLEQPSGRLNLRDRIRALLMHYKDLSSAAVLTELGGLQAAIDSALDEQEKVQVENQHLKKSIDTILAVQGSTDYTLLDRNSREYADLLVKFNESETARTTNMRRVQDLDREVKLKTVALSHFTLLLAEKEEELIISLSEHKRFRAAAKAHALSLPEPKSPAASEPKSEVITQDMSLERMLKLKEYQKIIRLLDEDIVVKTKALQARDDEVKELQAQLQDLQSDKQRLYTQLAQATGTAAGTAAGTASTPHDVQGAAAAAKGDILKYVVELISSYKALINIAKEHIDDCMVKTEKLNTLSINLNQLSMPGIKKGEQVRLVTESLPYFPYFGHFVLPRDVKTAVQCVTFAIQHRQTKSLRYQQVYSRYHCLLLQAEAKLAEFESALTALSPPT